MGIAIIIIAAAAALYLFLMYQNEHIVVSRYTVETEKLDRDMTIVHLSDEHAKEFGPENRRLLKKVRAIEPDMIAVTGDVISRWTAQIEPMVQTMMALQDTAPVYYVPGNQEFGNRRYSELMSELSDVCEETLFNRYVELRGVAIGGLDELGHRIGRETFLSEFEKLDGFKILLSHYADFEELYQSYDIDLVLSGHAHGGQFILPFIGGLYSSTQGVFPKHYRGMNIKNGTASAISRGLGNSRFPFRLFNYPEIVVINVRGSRAE